MSDLSIDVPLGALLEEWAPRIGDPTCASGCSNCCERMTVLATAPEALALARTTPDRWSARLRRLAISADASPDEARNALLDQGPCVFLDSGGKCGVYGQRPDACRACHVWHEPAYCGHPDWEMCTPAELNQLRIENAYRRMLAEFDAGRRPFWGYLAPAVALASQHADAYRSGQDLRDRAPEAWLETELVEFPARERLVRELREHQEVFAKERNPMGSPRAADAADRDYLRPFREE